MGTAFGGRDSAVENRTESKSTVVGTMLIIVQLVLRLNNVTKKTQRDIETKTKKTQKNIETKKQRQQKTAPC